jgi:hypothetical protein
MSKLGITIGSAIALSVMVTVLYHQPSGASNALLAKAQSEFTAKARDAVLQRRAQATMGPVLASSPSTSEAMEPTQPVVSAEPVAPSAPAPLQTSERGTPERPAATAEPLEAPVVVAKPPVVEAAAGSEPKLEEIKPESKPLSEAKPVLVETAVQNIEPLKQPEPPKAAAPQVVTPATAKTQKTSREPAKTASAKKAGPNFRQLERDFSAGRMPYDAETLRARAPDIAAAMAPYM